MGSGNMTMENEILRQKSKCSECLSDKSKFLKQKPD